MDTSSTAAGATDLLNWLPIAISILALTISAFSLGWTIFRDVKKPRFRVDIAKKRIVQQGNPPSDPFIAVEALNLGPIPNRIGLVFAEKSWWQRNILRSSKSRAFISADYAHPATSPLQIRTSRIEIGDTACHAFPYDANCFVNESWTRIGFADGYGRMHWAPKWQVRKLREQYNTDFGEHISDAEGA